MRIELAYVSPRHGRLKSSPAQALVADFLGRAARYVPSTATPYNSEQSLVQALDRPGRTAAVLLLLDSRGEALTSEELATFVGQQRDSGMQQLVCAIGPADGWSAKAWSRANLRLSFGAITLPHELALVVTAEQIYRALTILAGHPYHSGH